MKACKFSMLTKNQDPTTMDIDASSPATCSIPNTTIIKVSTDWTQVEQESNQENGLESPHPPPLMMQPELPPHVGEQDITTVIKNVMSFKLARDDPWLKEFSDLFTENEVTSVSGRRESRAAWLLRKLFMLTSLSLTRSQPGGPMNRVRMGLTFRGCKPFHQLDPINEHQTEWRRILLEKLLGVTSLVLFACCATSILVCCFTLYQHDTMMIEMKPTLIITGNYNHNKTSSRVKLKQDDNSSIHSSSDHYFDSLDGQEKIMCALKEDIAYGAEFQLDKLVIVNEWMDLLGFSIRGQMGSCFLSTSIIATGALVFFCLPLIFTFRKGRRVRLDSIAFIVTPSIERRRLLKELEQVIGDIMAALDQTCHENLRLVKLENRLFGGVSQRRHQTIGRASESTKLALDYRGSVNGGGGGSRNGRIDQMRYTQSIGPINGTGPNQQARLLSHIEKIKFMAALNEIRSKSLVRPIVICSKWHRDLQRYACFLIILFILISSILPQLSTLVMYVVELYLRSSERCNQFKCKQWHPNGTLFKPNFPLLLANGNNIRGNQDGVDEMFQDQAERKAYESYYDDGSGNGHSILYLMFVYETRHMLNWRMLLNYLEIVGLIEILSICSVLWTSVFVISFLDKIAWLVQIRGQLAQCCDVIFNHSINCTSLEDDQRWASDSPELEQLQKIITIAYVNYELFRRQYKPFRRLTNFLVFQAIAFSACSFIALYLVATRMDSKFKVVAMYASMCVLITLDIYLVLASYVSKVVERIMIDLMRLFALASNYPKLLVRPPLDLWRRQLISKHEVDLFGTTKILSMIISYEKILSFNVQLIGLWLLLMRAFSKKSAEAAKNI